MMSHVVYIVLLLLLPVNSDAACQIPNCSQCNGVSGCDKCEDGYWHDNGSCNKCSTNCLICSLSTQCESCVASYWSPLQLCVVKCSFNCTDRGCNGTTGLCYECKHGTYGPTCDQDCTLCVNNECDRRKCAHGCKDGYFQYNGTGICLPCSRNCEKCSNGTYCTHCEQGFYGSYYHNIDTGVTTLYCHACDDDCTQCTSIDQCQHCGPECINSGCDVSGTCTTKPTTPRTSTTSSNRASSTNETTAVPNGPSVTTEGGRTNKHDEQPINTTEEKTSDNSMTIIGAAAGGGAFVLLLIVIGIIICFIKRRSSKREENHLDANIDHQVVAEPDYPVYAKPNKPSNSNEESQDYLYAQPNKPRSSDVESQDNLYAQPNKPKKNSKHNKNKLEEPPRMSYSDLIIDIDIEQVAVNETDTDGVTLECVDDDGLTKDIDTGDNIPTSDTYYNMEGLVRSQIKVSELLEYVRRKADYDTEFKKLLKGLQRSCNEALKPNNRMKNRYNGIYAYDATRVELQSKSYINANYIDGHEQSNTYIASLGPTADTMNKYATFWEMIWQENVETIVMLTNLREGEKMKCEQYWPGQSVEVMYGTYSVKCVAETTFAEFVIREFVLQSNKYKEKHTVVQYHYTAWPDRSVPASVVSLVAFRDKVEQQQRKMTSPVVVHCSAGIGRTGTYIALDILIKQGREENYVDIFGCAIGLRGQRVNMIQNEVQYEYLHHCVLYAVTCDTDPVKGTAIERQVTKERIAAQYNALTGLDSVIRSEIEKSTGNRNRKENRKGSDVPDDQYRVHLTLSKNDYINAVYINGYLQMNQFIAAQTPMPSTVHNFISMIYQEQCQCIVSLDDKNESDKSIGHYIPSDKKISTFGEYQLSCTECEVTNEYITRDLKLSQSGSQSFLLVRHVQFRGWKSKEILPSDTKSFLKLIVEVKKSLGKRRTAYPVIVHCLTGSERSGLFCTVSTMLEILAVDKQLSTIHSVCHVRDRRRSAMQKQEMFQFCYDCVKDFMDLSENNPYYNMHLLSQ